MSLSSDKARRSVSSVERWPIHAPTSSSTTVQRQRAAHTSWAVQVARVVQPAHGLGSAWSGTWTWRRAGWSWPHTPSRRRLTAALKARPPTSARSCRRRQYLPAYITAWLITAMPRAVSALSSLQNDSTHTECIEWRRKKTAIHATEIAATGVDCLKIRGGRYGMVY